MPRSPRRSHALLNLSVLIVNMDRSSPHPDVMRRHGWTVELVAPDEARSRAAALQRDAVIIDEGKLPSFAAFDLARRLKSEVRSPTIVLSRLGAGDIGRHAQAAGCSAISKPCRIESLMTAIRSAAALAVWSPRRDRTKAIGS